MPQSKHPLKVSKFLGPLLDGKVVKKLHGIQSFILRPWKRG